MPYAIEVLVQGNLAACRIRFGCTPVTDFRGLPTACRTASFAEIRSLIDLEAIRDQVTP